MLRATTMDEETDTSRYWCHMCSRTVNPIIEIDTVKCPICQSGFVEEMASTASPTNDSPLDFDLGGEPDPERALSLWAPILLGMMGNSRRHRIEIEDDGGEPELESGFDQELELIIRRRRRNSATIIRLLQDMRASLQQESGDFLEAHDERAGSTENEREDVILVNQEMIVPRGGGSFGDYLEGPGLDQLLQHLLENDPNRYGTLPARKEAVEGLPDVEAEEVVQCSVCLDECGAGVVLKEMPCKHKFHGECIIPWLKLHSSCPVCRYRLPCDESKIDSEGPGNSVSNEGDVGESGDERSENGRQFSVTLPWPFSGLFSSSGSRLNAGNLMLGPSRDGHTSSSHGEGED